VKGVNFGLLLAVFRNTLKARCSLSHRELSVADLPDVKSNGHRRIYNGISVMIHSLIDRHHKLRFRTGVDITLPGISLVHLILACITGVTIGLLSLVSPWLALAGTLAVIVCVAALLKPILLCYLIVVAIVLTSGMERGKLIPFLKPNEVVLAFSAGISFIIILTRKTYHRVNLHQIGAAVIVLVAGTTLIPGISYLVRGTQLTVEDDLTLLAPLQYVLLFWLFAYLPSNNVERRRIIKLMVLCGAVVAAVGLLQGAKIGFVTDLLRQWYGSSQQTEAAGAGRVTSLLSAWNALGIFLMVNLIITWAFGISRPSDLGKVTNAIVMTLGTACLVVSGSYAGVIGLIIGIIIVTFLLRGINRKTLFLFLCLALVTSITLMLFETLIRMRLNTQFGYGGAVPQTLLYRFKVWQEIFLPAVQQNLLWGINPTVPTTYSWQYTESQFITLLFSFGLVGLIAYLAWNAIILTWLNRRFRQRNGILRPVTAIAIAIIIVLFIAGFTNAVFTYSGTADYLWIMLALITADEDSEAQALGEKLMPDKQWSS